MEPTTEANTTPNDAATPIASVPPQPPSAPTAKVGNEAVPITPVGSSIEPENLAAQNILDGKPSEQPTFIAPQAAPDDNVAKSILGQDAKPVVIGNAPAAAETPGETAGGSIVPPTIPGGEPPTEPAPVTPANASAGVVVGGKRRRFGKRTLGIAAIVALILLLGGGYVFGYYIPNKPANMWNSALVNTGKAYDTLTAYATAPSTAKGWTTDGTFKLKGPVVADGTFQGKNVGSNGEFTGSVSAAGLKLDLDVRTIKSTGDTPDLYFKVNGLQGLGSLLGGSSADIGSAFNGINNQWFFVDHTLFEQLGQSASSTQISKADVSALLKDIGTPSKQYLFTDNTQKAAIVVKQQIGREKLDGRSVYHYKVALDEKNMEAYVKAVCLSVKNDKIGKLLETNTGTDCSIIQQDFTSTRSSGTADAWVDTHTKLIHTIRFTDKSNSSNYIDVSQDYQGGSSYPFSVSIHDKSGGTASQGSLKLVLDSKANTVNVTGQFQSGSGKDAETGSLTMSVKPNNDASLKVDKPAGAKNLLELLDGLGLGQLLGNGATGGIPLPDTSSGTVQSQARDAERTVDLKTLQSQLEASFARNGKYPTLAQLNDPTWRKANMQGMDNETLRDPQGTGYTVVAKPAAKSYAYAVTSDGSSYTLTATLESGQTDVLKSLN